MKQNIVFRRLVSAFLAICFVASGFTPCYEAFAGETHPPDSNSQVIVSSESVVPGEPVKAENESEKKDKPESESESDSSSSQMGAETDVSSSTLNTEDANESPSSGSNLDSNSQSEDNSTPSDSTEQKEDVSSSESSAGTADEDIADNSGEDTDANSVNSSDSQKPVAPSEEEVAPKSDVKPESKEDKTDFKPISIVVSGETNPTYAIGQNATFSIDVTNKDVAVSYQWQVLKDKNEGIFSDVTLHPYGDVSPTYYDFPFSNITESEALEHNPDLTWPGIELYLAVVAAMDEANIDSSNVQIAWKVPNYVLSGYSVRAEQKEDKVVIYAEKGSEQFIGAQDAEGKWSFDGTPQELTFSWTDIPEATEKEYSYPVTENNLGYQYRCQVTIKDEDYKQQCIAYLEDNGTAVPEEQKAQEQILISPSFSASALAEMKPMLMSAPVFFSNSATEPYMSSDGQWIDNLNAGYQYITKDTYDRVTKWLSEGKITQKQANRYWTRIGQGGFGQHGGHDGYTGPANTLDENGFPIGGENNYRLYNGFNLVDGHKLQINSEWYDKTVYFRPYAANQRWEHTGTAIHIPAYTSLENDANGNYIEGSSGMRYKHAITVLNPFVDADTDAKYQTFANFSTDANGWVLNDGLGYNNIQVLTISCENFNDDPQRYMLDAEGNYRVDSVAWGVCVGAEPDLSGKSYWELKRFLEKGYGFMIGHDTLYAYAGTYYDCFGVPFNENTIDPNDGETWYYALNSYIPGMDNNGHFGTMGYSLQNDYQIVGNKRVIQKLSRDGNNQPIQNGTSQTRGGHFYMNELMGSNRGNIYSKTDSPRNSISGILSMGGSSGSYGKAGSMYGGNTIYVELPKAGPDSNKVSTEMAKKNPRLRLPTNYPFDFISQNRTLLVSLTHTNNQMAFGPVWVRYPDQNAEIFINEYGYDKEAKEEYVDNLKGTNNFYLTGEGNFLMNQIGHLPQNTATDEESRLLLNSFFYISQRKQCEICAAGQNGQGQVHHVIRVSNLNKDKIFSALQNGGNFWYPIDGCYQLTQDIQLADNWKPIKNFKGHWNSDVYEIKLGANKAPFLYNEADQTLGKDGWNLGIDQNNGVVNVFNGDMTHSTGVARVVGDLSDLFRNPDRPSYTNYKVEIRAADNPKYFKGAHANEVYSCIVNSDSKYVISNLPCIYDETTRTGILKARVFRPDGTEVLDYGPIRVNVSKDFWDNDMTTPLYLGGFTATPVADYASYEGGQVIYEAVGTSAKPIKNVRWEYSNNGGKTWNQIPNSWPYQLNNHSESPSLIPGEPDEYSMVSKITFTRASLEMNGCRFRAVFSNDFGEWNTYRFYQRYGVVKNEPFNGASITFVDKADYSGYCIVDSWPVYTEQGPDKTVLEGKNASFTAYGLALDDGNSITARWQYSTPLGYSDNGIPQYEWRYVDDDRLAEFNGYISTSNSPIVVDQRPEIDRMLLSRAPNNDINTFHQNAKFHGLRTTLYLNQVDLKYKGTTFRVEYKAKSKTGEAITWYSDIANDTKGRWNNYEGTIGGMTVVSQPNNGNRLSVIPPQIDVVATKSNDFASGRTHADTITPDEYGQSLELNLTDSGVSPFANGTAYYQATIYYKPKEMAPVASWEYTKYRSKETGKWDTNAAHRLGYPSVSVSVSNSAPVSTSYRGEPGWMKYTSTMSISGVPSTMYKPEELLKYYFRCTARTNIMTSEGDKSVKANGKYGGLNLKYQIALQHNGVMEYAGGRNYVNGAYVSTKEEAENKLSPATTWSYPNLKIKIPAGQHINTVFVRIEGAPSNRINIDTNAITNSGITIEQNDGKVVKLISSRANSVGTATWENVLRHNMSFVSYDINGHGTVTWGIDEARREKVEMDPDTGSFYKVIRNQNNITWEQAANLAMREGGSLVEIGSDHENNYIARKLNPGEFAWLGASRVGNSVFKWTSAYPGNNIPKYYWRPYAQTNNPNLYIGSDGRWNSGPIITTTTVESNTRTYGGRREWNSEAFTDSKLSSAKNNAFTVGSSSGTRFSSVNFSATEVWSNDPAGDCFVQLEYRDVNGTWHPVWGVNGQLTNNGSNKYYSNSWGYPGGPTGYRFYVYNNARAYAYSVKAYGTFNVREWIYRQTTKNEVNTVIVEYDPNSMGMAITGHSANDSGKIVAKSAGSGEVITPTKDEYTVSVINAEKIYDGQKLIPDKNRIVFTNSISNDRVTLAEMLSQNNKLLANFNVVIYANDAATAAHFGLAPKETSLANFDSICPVNKGNYIYQIKLSPNADILLNDDSENSKGRLTITPRPINLTSHNNNKVYDKTSKAVISNIVADEASSTNLNRGIIPKDKNIVAFTRQTDGQYVNKNGDPFNIVGKWDIKRTGTMEFTSNPCGNYYIESETYSGSITKRPLHVHSLYKDSVNPEKNPRNVKMYDGTTKAMVTDIEIDNIVEGDRVELEKEVYFGNYSSANAGENLSPDGHALPDRRNNLAEYQITLLEKPVLTGYDCGNYEIVTEAYSGAIMRRTIHAKVKDWSDLYGNGMTEEPYHYTGGITGTQFNPEVLKSWLHVNGLAPTDTLVLNNKSYFEIKDLNMPTKIQPDTPVGDYILDYKGLNESNYPVLKNYLVIVDTGMLSVKQRNILIDVDDADKMLEDENPNFYSTFFIKTGTNETSDIDEEGNSTGYKKIGNDKAMPYSEMNLVAGDKLSDVVFVTSGEVKSELKKDAAGKSNIYYDTPCEKNSPVKYLAIDSDPNIYPCPFCQNYWGIDDAHANDCAHWNLTGYRINVNSKASTGLVLTVKEVRNPYGDMVQNYRLEYLPGSLLVHPKLRFQLKATVPMYVCMHGNNTTGEIVEPTGYGITNYSNGAIKVDDIAVVDDAEGAWNIVQPDLLSQAGEMSMKMNDTQLVNGSNSPVSREKWIAARAQENGDGTFMPISIDCRIAPDSVNATGETYVTKVRYTISEYGITLPEGHLEPMPDHLGPNEVNPLH